MRFLILSSIVKTISINRNGRFFHSRLPSLLWGLLFAFLYAILVGLVCRHGAEVAGWDSLCYLAFAKSGHAADLPLHHGIGYAVLLRAFMLLFGDVQRATACCNVSVAFLFAWVLATCFLRRFGRLGLMAAGAVLLNFAVLENFGRTMSEAFFILLLSISCFFLDHAIRHGQMRPLVLSALAMAAACLTRYAGVAFAASFALVVWATAGWTHRGLFRAMLHGIISSLPLLAVMSWNHILRGTATNRVLAFHLPRLAEFSDAGTMLASWLFPDRLWLAFPFLSWTILVLAVIGLGAICIRAFSIQDNLALFWWLPVGVYLIFLFVAFSFFDSNISFDRRMLSPIVFFVVGGLCLHGRRADKGLGIAIGLLFGWLCMFGAVRARGFAMSRFAHGSGYYGEAWAQSELVKRLESESTRRIVYSNADMGFTARGTTGIRGLVCTKTASSWQEIPGWQDTYRDMVSDLGNGAILARVLLESGFWREEYVPLEQIVRDAGLEPLVEYPDGTIWGIPALKDEFTPLP